jgi:hypothetical protein
VPFYETRLDQARFKKPIEVQLKGHIISSLGGQQSVSGIIVKNPFKRNRLIPAGRIDHSPFQYLGTTGDLICMLSDWHNVEDEIDQYHLTRLEGVQIGDTLIYRCVGTWKNIIGKKASRK